MYVIPSYVKVEPHSYNIYLNKVRFPKVTSQVFRNMQLNYVFQSVLRFNTSKFTDPGYQVYQKAMKYIESHQDEYSITVEDLHKKMCEILRAMSKIIENYCDNQDLDYRILDRGYSEFNQKFFEDMCSLQFNVVKYIGALNIIAEDWYWLAY